MTPKIENKTWKGVLAMRAFLAMPIIIALMVFPVPVWAESSVPQEDAEAQSQLPLIIAQVQPESGSEEIDDDSVVFDDLEDLEEGEQVLEEESASIADPLQPWNRMWHHFNDKTYFWMFKPMAQGYRFVVPEGFRISFSNFYTNATAPVRIFNSLFQLKINYFFTEFGRFLINTTIGVVGMRDCAKDCFGIKPHDEDFGQTLGHYGVGHGIYLVWPFLGPSSVRDTIGKGADSFLSFTGILSPVDLEVPVWVGLKTHEIVNDISLRIGDYERLKEAAIDPYIAIRDGYAQRRKKAVQE
jgi:phospholipid-binding lipoprotein MlaA